MTDRQAFVLEDDNDNEEYEVVAGHGAPQLVSSSEEYENDEVDLANPLAYRGSYKAEQNNGNNELEVIDIADHEIKVRENRRIDTGYAAFNMIFSGDHTEGFVPGKRILMAGEHGAGKSTLALELGVSLAWMAAKNPDDPDKGANVIFVANEMSVNSIIMKLERMGLRNKLAQCKNRFSMTYCDDVDKLIWNLMTNEKFSNLIPKKPENTETMADFVPDKEVVLIVDSGSCMKATNTDGSEIYSDARRFKVVCEALGNFSSTHFVTLVMLGHMGSAKTAKGGTFIPHLYDTKFDMIKIRDKDTGTVSSAIRIDKHRDGPSGLQFGYTLSSKGSKWDDFGTLELTDDGRTILNLQNYVFDNKVLTGQFPMEMEFDEEVEV